MPPEKRKDYRLPKNFQVEVREFKFPLARQKTHEIFSVDISAGGLLVECGQNFAVGEKLQVKIFIASLNKYHPGFFKVFESDAGQHLQVIAEVVRSEERVPLTRYVLGLRFLDVDQDDWNALRKFIMKVKGK